MLIPILIGAVSALAILAHVAPFRFALDLAHRDMSVWRMPVAGSAKPIYLTFDDGPNPTATPDLLTLLQQKDVKATFFLIDDYVTADTAPIVRRMFDEGHCVAQHTGRRWLLARSPAHVESMLEAGASKIEQLAGHRPARLFRPHAGWRSEALYRGAARANYTIVGWSWMSWDWVGLRQRTGPRVAQQVLAHAGPGKIVVIHDGHHRNPRADRAYAIDAAARLADGLRAEGYRFRTLCEDLPPGSSASPAK